MSHQKAPLDCFYDLLTGIMAAYGLAGIIDLAIGTGMTHIALADVLSGLKARKEKGAAEIPDELLLKYYRALLRQLLHNIGADDDPEAGAHLTALDALCLQSPEPLEEREVDRQRFVSEMVLHVIHNAIGENK